MPTATHNDRLSHLAATQRVFRGSAAVEAGVPWAYLGRAVAAGDLVRLARGLYAHPDYAPSENGSLAEVARLVPKATICLLSAMRFHGLTTQNPPEVWILVDRRGRRPSRSTPAMKVVAASGGALTAGVEVHNIDGVAVSITSIAKTVCDGFRYRRHIGLDVAIEALRDALQNRRATPAEIADAARSTRIATVIRPYLEALS